jgi:hypothetical protein
MLTQKLFDFSIIKAWNDFLCNFDWLRIEDSVLAPLLNLVVCGQLIVPFLIIDVYKLDLYI